MNKLFGIGLICVCTAFAYLILAVMMPGLNEISSAAATELTNTSNMSNYPGTLEVVESSGWWLWALPGVVAIVATAIFLKRGDRRG